MTLDEMIRQKDVIVEDEAIYLPPFFFSERGTALRLARLLCYAGSVRVRREGLGDRISRETGMCYDETQMRAIEEAVSGKVFILTGGPGTGKTTTTLGIITAFREAGAKVLLAAPQAGLPNGSPRPPAWRRRPFIGCWSSSRRRGIRKMRRILWRAMC